MGGKKETLCVCEIYGREWRNSSS
uniref:Uncharacterized protein n=1 Tax=Anguilla anguilla TaxID=7936 RepID=A0A0E9QWR6_ANGAN